MTQAYQQRAHTKVDFQVRNHGSVWNIEAISKAAKLFVKENLVDVEGWMGTPENFFTDHRPARELCEQLIADGFKIRKV